MSLSRPYQVALAALVALAVVWFVALHGHSSGGGGATPSPSAPSSSSASSGGSSGSSGGSAKSSPSPIYHGSAPGVEGLSKAIAKAHEAVKTSEQNANSLQSKSAQASGETATGTQSAGSQSSNGTGAAATSPSSSHTQGSSSSSSATGTHGATAASGQSSSGGSSRQAEVAHELAQGKVVLVLLWNPKSYDDVAVHQSLDQVARKQGRKVALHAALPSEVASFGIVTQTVRVNQTPTILIINKKGLISNLTGLVDAFAIEQAIREAVHEQPKG
jgi:hypothetical protein